jgi:hypothetical protein
MYLAITSLLSFYHFISSVGLIDENNTFTTINHVINHVGKRITLHVFFVAAFHKHKTDIYVPSERIIISVSLDSNTVDIISGILISSSSGAGEIIPVLVGFVFAESFSFLCIVLQTIVCTFSFRHCIDCPSIYGFWLPPLVSSNFFLDLCIYNFVQKCFLMYQATTDICVLST